MAYSRCTAGVARDMKIQLKQIKRWPCLEFSRLDVKEPEEVAGFIVWLGTGRFPGEWKNPNASSGEIDDENLVEALWNWSSAPRKRMAKLLWQLLVRNKSHEHFAQFFTIDEVWITRQIQGCAKLLVPIHKKLRWVLDGFMERKQQDVFIGQGSWGEEWLLPAKQAAFVRKRLQRARPDLLQESSNYEDSLRYFSPPYFEQVCDDKHRIYVGEHGRRNATVWIEDIHGNRHPLSHASSPFSQPLGTGFGWGYCGGGPSELSKSILADAIGGNLQVAERWRIPFMEDVLSTRPWTENFKLSFQAVREWLTSRGIGQQQLNDAAADVRNLKKTVGHQVDKHKARLNEIEQLGGLLAQRFDIVPSDFESALYVDLMHMFERAGWVLRCSHCAQPVPCDRSPRGNRQRARWLKGQPIYHESCFTEHRRSSKRLYWEGRNAEAGFREAERERGRRRRLRKSVGVNAEFSKAAGREVQHASR
jgi:hypothetical protein